jgi:phospholipase/lecithinase/hemolysin
MDVFSLFESVIADPSQYGFTNATEISPNYSVPDNFDNTEGYVFWDDIHPTTETHKVVANQVYQLLVPDEADDDDDDDDDDNPFGCFINTVLLYKLKAIPMD